MWESGQQGCPLLQKPYHATVPVASFQLASLCPQRLDMPICQACAGEDSKETLPHSSISQDVTCLPVSRCGVSQQF